MTEETGTGDGPITPEDTPGWSPETGATSPITDGEREAALREVADTARAVGWKHRKAVVAYTLINDGMLVGDVSFKGGGVPIAASVRGITPQGRAFIRRKKDAWRRFWLAVLLLLIGACFGFMSAAFSPLVSDYLQSLVERDGVRSRCCCRRRPAGVFAGEPDSTSEPPPCDKREERDGEECVVRSADSVLVDPIPAPESADHVMDSLHDKGQSVNAGGGAP